MHTFEFYAGTDIKRAAEESVRYSRRTGKDCAFDFNGFRFVVTRYSTADHVVAMLHERYDEASKTPEAIERRAKHEAWTANRRQEKQATVDAAVNKLLVLLLGETPSSMEIARQVAIIRDEGDFIGVDRQDVVVLPALDAAGYTMNAYVADSDVIHSRDEEKSWRWLIGRCMGGGPPLGTTFFERLAADYGHQVSA